MKNSYTSASNLDLGESFLILVCVMLVTGLWDNRNAFKSFVSIILQTSL